MRFRFLILTAVWAGFALCTHPAQAAFMTGKTLLGLCASTDAENVFSCENYIAGVVDYHILVRSLGTAPSVDFCLPKDVRMQQLRQIVTNHLAKHPEQQNFVAAPAVTLSLYGTYPCAAKKHQK